LFNRNEIKVMMIKESVDPKIGSLSKSSTKTKTERK
jgi:hypothetical protein